MQKKKQNLEKIRMSEILFQPHELCDPASEKDRQVCGGEEKYRKLIILFANFIQSIGEQLKIRQQVIATATGEFEYTVSG